MNWARARAVADAVMYEGYLLYPYRGTSRKNQSRWQFGVLGPPGAAAAGFGEDNSLGSQFLVHGDEAELTFVVRFLQLQRRVAQRITATGEVEDVAELTVGSSSWLTWDEATECELTFGPFSVADLAIPRVVPMQVPGNSAVEIIGDRAGRLERTRVGLIGEIAIAAIADDGLLRIDLALTNSGRSAVDSTDAIARSFIGAHAIVAVTDGEFVSLLEPPPSAEAAVERCVQHRCFPVLAGPPGTVDLLLVSPIILYDHPEIAEQSEGALFDSTEIDEILTLRVMTMTDDEKAQARATDPLAAELIDRCDSMTPEALQRLHGVLRSPRGLIPEVPDDVPWWTPEADEAVAPDTDAVLVGDVRVAKGSRVRLHPSRRADAHDLFYDGKLARVTSVHEDVEGNAHVAVVLDDDPAADLHEWYGRYLYFAPDEVEPIDFDRRW